MGVAFGDSFYEEDWATDYESSRKALNESSSSFETSDCFGDGSGTDEVDELNIVDFPQSAERASNVSAGADVAGDSSSKVIVGVVLVAGAIGLITLYNKRKAMFDFFKRIINRQK